MKKSELYSQTYTGKQFHYFDVKPEEIDIVDIAHSLSNQCRFNGHTEQFYSVAEHVYHTSYIVESGYEMEALLHDAAEAYIGDIPKPFKSAISDVVKPLENDILEMIFDKYDLESTTPLSKPVKAADYEMLYWERRELMVPTDYVWYCFEGVSFPKSRRPEIHCWGPVEAKAKFLERFEGLTGR